MNAPTLTAEDELFALLVEKAYEHDGDFDEWLREGDPEDISFARELVVSAYWKWRPATPSQIDHRLEGTWLRVVQDISIALEDDR